MKTNFNIKYFLIFTVLISSLFTYGNVSAFEIMKGEDVSIEQEVNDDLYIAGGRVEIKNIIHGDLIIAGGEIEIDSEVSEDVIMAGGDIFISANIGDDLRVVGGSVVIDSVIEGDVIVGAGDLKIKKGAIIRGDLAVGAGRVIIDGEVFGKTKISADEFILNGKIHGDVDLFVEKFKNTSGSGIMLGNVLYKTSEKNILIEESTQGTAIYTEAKFQKHVKEKAKGFLGKFIIIKIIGIFVFSTFLYFFLEKVYLKTADKLYKQTGKAFLYGLLTIILTPIIAILLFISVVGIPIGAILLVWYILLLLFLDIINATVLTGVIQKKFGEKMNTPIKLVSLLGFSILFGVTNGLSLLIGFFSIGAICLVKGEIIDKIRK
ncbi:hypothetical protein A9Q91_02850 [Candidatus Gracilibacteria bacterium 28_42_T64]|nr:hypothetical protein A9Q91_02850 [Candidatus Gracilibacteria bacterium 28_42_T64]